jgi:hypothetical protein
LTSRIHFGDKTEESAGHNLKSASIDRGTVRVLGVFGFIEIVGGGCAMRIALEINFALWIMTGCAAAEISQVVGYLY